MDGWASKTSKQHPAKTSMKTYSWRPFGDVFCSFVWGSTRRWPTTIKTERFGAPGPGWGSPPNIHTYKHTYLLNKWSIRTFDTLKSIISLYGKTYLHDIYHGFRTKHTYIHFKNGYFLWPPIPRNHGKYHAKTENPQTNNKNELLRGHVCMEECGKYRAERGLTYKTFSMSQHFGSQISMWVV